MGRTRVTVVRAGGVVDVDTGETIDGGYVRVEGRRIVDVGTGRCSLADADDVFELPELTLIPGLMDMEVDLLLGGPGAGLMDPVCTDPVKMTLRATVNAKRTLLAGFTTVRNLGLFVKTGGYLLDVALSEAIEAGWIEGCRVIPAGHAIVSTGGHLDPSAQSGLAPHIMPLTVEEGVADGVDAVRRGGALSDSARCEGDQVLRVGGFAGVGRPMGRSAVFGGGTGRDRGRGASPGPQSGGPLPR